MALATLSIDLVAKLAELQTGMDKAGRIAEKNAAQIEARYKRMGDVARSVGAALGASISVAGITQFVKATIDGIDALNDLKDATGASIENLSALEDIAVRTGTSMDSVSTALVKLNQTLNTAKPGSEAAKALEAIGLSAEELRKVDPAEALLEIAKALATYADDGEKARLTQLLFGKSIREVAPLLNDLANAGKLNATVTTQQALEAEKFNQQLSSMYKNASDVAREISGPLVSALNGFFATLSKASNNKDGFFAGLNEQLNNAGIRGNLRELNMVLSQGAQQYQEDLALLSTRGGADIGMLGAVQRAFASRRVEEYERLRKAAEEYRVELDKQYQGGARRPANEGGGRLRLSLGSEAGAGGGGSSARADRPGPGYGPMGPFPLDEVNTPLSEAARDALRAIEATDIIKIQKINETLDQLFLLRATGGGVEVDEAIDALTTQLGALGPAAQSAADEVQPAMAEISEFAQEAARNIQDALGDTLQASLAGNFDSIEGLWKNMLTRMVAEAAAAQLNTYLFGTKGVGSGGGALGGLGDLFDFLTKGFSVSPRAAGGPITAGRAYLVGEKGPEIVVPRSAGTVLPNGVGAAAPTYVVNVQGDASENTLRLIRGAMAQFEARQMMRAA